MTSNETESATESPGIGARRPWGTAKELVREAIRLKPELSIKDIAAETKLAREYVSACLRRLAREKTKPLVYHRSKIQGDR